MNGIAGPWNDFSRIFGSFPSQSIIRKSLTMKATATLLAIGGVLTVSAPGALIITGVFDGPLPGGTPKGIELFATSDIADLSNFGIGSANNGGGTDGVESILPSQALAAGSFFLVTSELTNASQWFGSEPDHVAGSAVGINGDDAIELFDLSGGGETVIDVFGDINTDGNGTPWEYLDGWAYRNDGVLANGGTFDPANWSFSGPNEWDGDDNFGEGSDNGTNVTATPPFPAGTFQVPEPTSTLLGGIGLALLCFLRRKK